MKKGVFILCLAICLLFTLSSVCASDMNDTTIASEDTGQMELSSNNDITEDDLQTSEEDNTLTQTNDCEILGADENGTFTELQNEIYNAGNGTLNLSKNYKWDSEFTATGIVINNSITINGNGHTIDALNHEKLRIFEIKAKSGVTLNNITFKNGNSDGCGGAINVWYDLTDSEFTNLNFINNYAADNGGAIRFRYSSTNNLFENITFENNTDKKNGGALYMGGISSSDTFRNVKFINNTAKTKDAGAINFHGKVDGATFDNVLFYKNRAEQSVGGAINIDAGIVNSIFNNTYFIDNAAKTGGAIGITKVISALAFENTYFINNTALTDDGGAINIGPWDHSDLANTTFKKVAFINNTAAQNGGALYVTKNTTSNNFEDVVFINNTAEGGDGGAVRFGAPNYQYTTKENTFKMVLFANNTANKNGGALYVTGASLSNVFEQMIFANNTAKTKDAGAINFRGNVEGATFDNVLFHKNRAEKSVGGSINIDAGIVNSIFNNTYFIDNAAKTAGAIGITGYILSLTFEKTNFINNTALTDDGGAINIGPWAHSDLANTTFKKVAFINNTAAKNGGALYVTKITKTNNFEDVVFINNTAKGGDGGAVRFGAPNNQYSTEGNTFKMVLFANNTANNNGGALYVTGKSISNVFEQMIFANNTAKTKDGGAINFYNTVNDTTFNETLFYKNSAPNSRSGAVNFDKGMKNSRFNNTIFKQNSGLITSVMTLSSVTSSNTFENIRFLNNTADNYLIYINNATSDNIIQDSIFLDNNAKIVVKNGNIQMTDNWFGNNATNYDENPNVYENLDNWLFLNATASPAAITLDQTSTIKFKFYSYDSNAKTTNEYGGSVSVPLALDSTHGLVNESIAFTNEEILYTPSEEGNGTVTGKYGNAYYTIAIENNKIPTVIKLTEDGYAVYVDDTRDNLAVLQDKDGNNITDEYTLTYTSNNESVVKIVNDSFVAVGEGIATITVSFNGTNRYGAAEDKTFNVGVVKIPTKISVANATLNLKALENFTAGASLTPAEAGNLIYTSSNSTVAVVEDGQIKALAAGTAVITVSFAGNYKYAAAENKTITVNVSFADARVSVNKNTLDLKVGDTFNIVATTVPAGLKVVYITDNSGVVSVDANGKVTALKAGSAAITVKISGNGVYAENSTTVAVTVSKISTSIGASSVTTVYNVNKNLVITLKDANGNPLTGVKVTVNLNGAKTYTTNNNGQIIINVAKLVPKTYAAKMTFNGNDKYAGSSAEVKVIVKKAKPKIVAKKKTYRLKAKTKKFTITLKDNKGKPIKKAKVRLIMKKADKKSKKTKSKKKYKPNMRKTNKKGKATFRIKTLKKKGNYKAIIKYKGNKYYKAVTKTVKIKVK